MAGLIAGPDFALGKGREGTSPILTALGAELGYEMTVIEPYHAQAQAQPISSTAVRQALAQGKVDEVAQLLGRRYVTRGDSAGWRQAGAVVGLPHGEHCARERYGPARRRHLCDARRSG